MYKFEDQDDMERQILKSRIAFNRDFYREIDKPQNEIEEIVFKNIKKHIREIRRNHQEEKYFKKSQYQKLKKLPLIDDMKFDNMEVRSLAEKKRYWFGKKLGPFKIKDVSKWFKVYEETRLWEARQDISKPVDSQFYSQK